MTDYEVDFSNVNSTRYLQPGTYHVRLVEVEERQGTQAPLFAWTFADDTGAKSTINTSLSENALWKLQEVFTALGVDATRRMRFSINKLRKLVGRAAIAQVEAEVGRDGKTYSKIGKLWKEQADQSPQSPPPNDDDYEADFDDIPFE